jgi:hypothetical protein
MAANEEQVGGDHYKKHGELQHWDVVVKFGLDYFQGQITRYVFRWKDKNGLEDLRKARHYLDKYIEVQEAALGKDGVSLTNIHHPETPRRGLFGRRKAVQPETSE